MSTPRTRTTVWFCAAVASLHAVAAWADGELDETFGRNGVTTLALPVQDISVLGGNIEAAGITSGSVSVIRLSPQGTVMGSPQISAQNVIASPTALVRDSVTGDIFAAGYRAKKFCLFPSPTGCRGWAYTYTAQFARFSATGALIASYEGGNCVGTKMLVGESNRLIAVCVFRSIGQPTSFQVPRFSTQGNQLVGQGFDSRGSNLRSAGALLRDGGAGPYYVGGYGSACPFTCSRRQYVLRLEPSSLLPDTTFGISGVVQQVLSVPIVDVQGMALDNSGRIVIGGHLGVTNSGVASLLGLRSDYGGGSKDCLSFSVLGILMRDGKVRREPGSRKHLASVR